eukprot:g48321.t1
MFEDSSWCVQMAEKARQADYTPPEYVVTDTTDMLRRTSSLAKLRDLDQAARSSEAAAEFAGCRPKWKTPEFCRPITLQRKQGPRNVSHQTQLEVETPEELPDLLAKKESLTAWGDSEAEVAAQPVNADSLLFSRVTKKYGTRTPAASPLRSAASIQSASLNSIVSLDAETEDECDNAKIDLSDDDEEMEMSGDVPSGEPITAASGKPSTTGVEKTLVGTFSSTLNESDTSTDTN